MMKSTAALTNNKNRGKKPNAGGDRHVGQRTRTRARPTNTVRLFVGGRKAEITPPTPFSWDLFVLAGNPTVHEDDKAGSQNVTPHNMFNSPDGLAFDSTGLLWIQTDGKTSSEGDYAGMGNNQMLVGDPDSGEIRRFMVGPKDCRNHRPHLECGQDAPCS